MDALVFSLRVDGQLDQRLGLGTDAVDVGILCRTGALLGRLESIFEHRIDHRAQRVDIAVAVIGAGLHGRVVGGRRVDVGRRLEQARGVVGNGAVNAVGHRRADRHCQRLLQIAAARGRVAGRPVRGRARPAAARLRRQGGVDPYMVVGLRPVVGSNHRVGHRLARISLGLPVVDGHGQVGVGEVGVDQLHDQRAHGGLRGGRVVAGVVGHRDQAAAGEIVIDADGVVVAIGLRAAERRIDRDRAPSSAKPPVSPSSWTPAVKR